MTTASIRPRLLITNLNMHSGHWRKISLCVDGEIVYVCLCIYRCCAVYCVRPIANRTLSIRHSALSSEHSTFNITSRLRSYAYNLFKNIKWKGYWPKHSHIEANELTAHNRDRTAHTKLHDWLTVPGARVTEYSTGIRRNRFGFSCNFLLAEVWCFIFVLRSSRPPEIHKWTTSSAVNSHTFEFDFEWLGFLHHTLNLITLVTHQAI